MDSVIPPAGSLAVNFGNEFGYAVCIGLRDDFQLCNNCIQLHGFVVQFNEPILLMLRSGLKKVIATTFHAVKYSRGSHIDIFRIEFHCGVE